MAKSKTSGKGKMKVGSKVGTPLADQPMDAGLSDDQKVRREDNRLVYDEQNSSGDVSRDVGVKNAKEGARAKDAPDNFTADGRKKNPAPSEAAVEAAAKSDIQKMREALAEQPKVKFYIPLSPGEKKGVAFETVNLNGLRIEIKKGIFVFVAQQVADVLAEHLQISESAGEEFRVDADKDREEALA